MKDENKIIAKKIFSLDSSNPELDWDEAALWDHIQGKIGLKRKTHRIMYAAASIGILIAVSLAVYFSNHTAVTIEHTVEMSDFESPQSNNLYDLEASTLEFIRMSCKKEILVCESAEFKALAHELEALEQEIASLEDMIATYGNDPSFVKSKIQIENLKSEIIGKLVQMIVS